MNSILIIDDDEQIGMSLSQVLSDHDYQVQYAPNGKEGIKLFNSPCKFDLVITDIRMPEMDGNEVARYLKASNEIKTPIVAITGYSHETNTRLFDFILMKPFSLNTFVKSVGLFV
jgi:CheY-like chemotaxis protein